jgi:hypothetical protein
MRISSEENAPVRNLDREGTYSTRWFGGNAIDWNRIPSVTTQIILKKIA